MTIKALPLITLALCVTFLAVQQASVSSRTKNVTALKTRIAEAKVPAKSSRASGRAPAGPNSKSSRPGTEGSGENAPQSLAKIDLQEFVEAAMSAETRSIPNIKAVMRMQSLILEATPEELIDLIQRTAELDVPDQVKQQLMGEFISGLADHDPKAALDLAFQSSSLNPDQQRWRLSEAFSKWIKKEPAEAIAWFDREVEKGSFESKSLAGGETGARTEFESAAIGSLLSANPALARERLLALSEPERHAVLGQSRRLRLDDENAVAHAHLVRESFSEEARAEVFAGATRDMLNRKDYAGLADYTRQIEASPSERVAIVEAAVGRKFERFAWERKSPTAEDVTEMQTFLQEQVPDSANRLTGSSLAAFGRHNQNFDDAAGMIRELHQDAPSDETIVGFLEASAQNSQNNETARELANRISDPTAREEMLERFK